MTWQDFLDQVVLHAGLPGRIEAESCVRDVLGALAPCLVASGRELVSERTGVDLEHPPESRVAGAGLDRFLWRVARARRVPRARAREEAQAVCAALVAVLDPADRRALRRALPEELAEWFADPALIAGPGRSTPASPARDTPATPRLGSRHPLGESPPRGISIAGRGRRFRDG